MGIYIGEAIDLGIPDELVERYIHLRKTMSMNMAEMVVLKKSCDGRVRGSEFPTRDWNRRRKS